MDHCGFRKPHIVTPTHIIIISKANELEKAGGRRLVRISFAVHALFGDLIAFSLFEIHYRSPLQITSMR